MTLLFTSRHMMLQIVCSRKSLPTLLTHVRLDFFMHTVDVSHQMVLSTETRVFPTWGHRNIEQIVGLDAFVVKVRQVLIRQKAVRTRVV